MNYLASKMCDEKKSFLTWNKQIPGKMKIKTAARLPRNLMTSPMLGIRMAKASDDMNQGVAIKIRRLRLVSLIMLTTLDVSTLGGRHLIALRSLMTLEKKKYKEVTKVGNFNSKYQDLKKV